MDAVYHLHSPPTPSCTVTSRPPVNSSRSRRRYRCSSSHNISQAARKYAVRSYLYLDVAHPHFLCWIVWPHFMNQLFVYYYVRHYFLYLNVESKYEHLFTLLVLFPDSDGFLGRQKNAWCVVGQRESRKKCPFFRSFSFQNTVNIRNAKCCQI